ncbi:GNAT family N-acetyltransferase [Halobacillus kuroshimensis]|uniref:GNAT family N-acetyltransferase n=1 Tax=Halobacillus kuroshimensis TaxID=302481 RepID=UPI0003F9D6F4|nr:GNAT family protein [Halobacillus kuroshimensis]
MLSINVDEQTNLRLLHSLDKAELFHLVDSSRGHLRRWLPWVDAVENPGHSLEFIESSLQQYAENNGFQAGIIYKGELAGVIGLHGVDWHHKSTSIGYWMGEPFCGKGLMTAACREVVRHCFQTLRLNRIELRVAVGNESSSTIPRRLGFAYEGRIREAEMLGKTYVDHDVFGLLESESEFA